MRVAAIIPAWNEAGAIGPTIRQLPRHVVDIVIVVDGGSTDATCDEARAAGAVVMLQQARGYGSACAEGAEHAATLGCDLLLFLDGDGADAGELAERLVGPVRDGSTDFAIATRSPREKGSMLWHQVLAGWLIGHAIGWSAGVRYRDMAAFRALRLETLRKLGMRQMTYGWNLEMQMRVAGMKMRVMQIELPYRRRVAGQSKVAGNLRGTLRATVRILATLVSITRELQAAPDRSPTRSPR